MKSGIYTLPLVLSLVVSSILSGGITQKIGYYVPSMLVAPSIMSIGEGLLSTLHRRSPTSHWVAYQFLSGFGLGFGMQTSGLAIQTVLPKEDVSTGIAINFFVQQLGGAVFTSVGQTILTNMLVSRLSEIPGFSPKLIVNEGATKLTDMVRPQDVRLVIHAYNDACRHIFLASMGLAFASLLCALGMEWKSIKKGRNIPSAPSGPFSPSHPSMQSALPPNGLSSPNHYGATSPLPSIADRDSPINTLPTKDYFEGTTAGARTKSLRSSIFRPMSRNELREARREEAILEERRHRSTLTRPAPVKTNNSYSHSHSYRPKSSAQMSMASEGHRDDLLAGALQDWARFSKATEKKELPLVE